MSYNEVETTERLGWVVSSFNNYRDRWQVFEVSVNFQFLQKTSLILNLRGQELITCSQVLNRILTMWSDKTLNYDCAKLSH